MSQCLGEAWRVLGYVADNFAELLAHGGAALAMPKFVHRESMRRLNMPRNRQRFKFDSDIILRGVSVPV